MQPQEPQYKPQPHQPVGTPAQVPQPAPTYNTPPNYTDSGAQPQHDYSFLTEAAPALPNKKGLSMGLGSGVSSLAGKLIVAGVGLFVLLVAFAIFKSLMSSGPSFSTTALMSVAQDQQELIHLTTNLQQTTQGVTMAPTTTSSFITVELTMTDAQKKLIQYLQTNKYKVNVKLLNAKVSTSVDTEITSAIGSGTIDQTYMSVMQTQLNTYCNDLKAAYAGDHGAKGRALLSADYDGAQLLLQQLNSPAS